MERIFYNSDVRDPITGGSIYVFDTSYLPPTDSINYDMFIPMLMANLPSEPYVLMMFSCGLNKISWVWGLKFLKLFLEDNGSNINNLKKVVTVHNSWFIKSVTQIVSNYNSTRRSISSVNKIIETFSVESPFSINEGTGPKIINCKNITELSHYIDITKLKISLNVYKYDMQQENTLVLAGRPRQLLHSHTKVNVDTDPEFFHHFYQIFNIIDSYGTRAELLFHKPGNKVNTDIFFSCINRDQLFWINDWDIYCIAAVFKRFLIELPEPLIPVLLVPIPMADDYDSTSRVVSKIVNSYSPESNYRIIFLQIFDLMYRFVLNTKTTKHTSVTLAKCMSHCLSHEIISHSNSAGIQIASRTIRNIIDHWPKLRNHYRGFQTVGQTIAGAQTDEAFDESYETSHDLSINDEADESRVAINTSNILDSEAGLDPWKEEEEEEKSFIVTPSKPRHLSDVSNIAVPQFPPQKYKFATIKKEPKAEEVLIVNSKKPVIRGRKVAQLASLFEERNTGFGILENM